MDIDTLWKGFQNILQNGGWYYTNHEYVEAVVLMGVIGSIAVVICLLIDKLRYGRFDWKTLLLEMFGLVVTSSFLLFWPGIKL